MSIIHEALKKVQSNRSQNNDLDILSESVEKSADFLSHQPKKIPANHPPKSAQTENTSSKKSRVLSAAFVWSLLILSLTVITFFNLFEFSARNTELSSIAYPALAPASPSKVPSSLPPKMEIILKGIATIEHQNFALINDESYEVGEQIGEEAGSAMITKINPDSVEIFQDGQTRILKVKRH